MLSEAKDRHLNVLHVVPAFHPAHAYGGPLYSTYQLCLALAERGLRVRVLTTNADGRRASLPVEPGHEVELAPRLSVRYCARVASHSVSPTLMRLLPAAVRWADVVHLTAVYSFPTWPTLLACRLSGRPAVWSPRGSLQTRSGPSRGRAKAVWRAVCRALAPPQIALHATSERERRDSASLMPGVAAFVVPNAVNPCAACPAPPLDGTLRMLCLGRLHPTKGLESLFRACALLRGREGRPWRLVVAGDGDERYAGSLRGMVRELGLEEAVSFVGDVRGPAKEQLFIDSHLVVVPSHTESFGMIVAEALAHARPVVASRGTPWEQLEERGCGLWVDNTPESLADAIRRIERMPMAEMGERGRAWMRQDFDWSKIAARMEAAYRALLETAA